MAHVIGIDFGLMNIVSVAADTEGPAIITPSLVYFGPEGGSITGIPGLDAAVADPDPDRAVLGVRRVLGDAAWRFSIDGAKYRAVDLVGLVFKRVAHDIEAEVGGVDGVVVAVPACFHDGQRRAVLEALASAGLPLLQIMNEPSAAALAYASTTSFRGTVVVYDLGDGNLDVTILDVRSPENIALLAVGGDLGAFDEPIATQAERSEAIVLRALKEADVKSGDVDAVLLVGSSAHHPEVAELLHRLFGLTPFAEIDPVLVVARGAAVKGGMILEERTRAA